MKKLWTRALSVLLAAACAGVLAGCSLRFDAAALVKGNMDLIYLNQYTDDYLQSVNMTAEDADKEYEEGLAVEKEYFAEYFDIDLESCDRGIGDQITALYRTVYNSSRYEVGSVTTSGDIYLVSVTICPMDIMEKVQEEDGDTFMDSWNARVDSGEFNAMSDAECENIWAQNIIDLVTARLSSTGTGYEDPQTISVQVTKGSDGAYRISDNDWSRIDELMIAY